MCIFTLYWYWQAEFTRVMDEVSQKASEEGSYEPNEIDVWRDTAGIKKGRIYGLGLESTVVDRRPYYRGSSSQSTDWMRRTEHEEMMKKMQEEKSELMARLERTETQVQFNNKLLQEMMKRMNFQIPDFQPPIEDTADGEEDGDEQDNDDDEEN